MKIFQVGKVRSKKASLSLSVNAIVVLVLGITMLGLGLAFTKGMFAKLKGKLEIPPPNIPATKDEPIVLPADEVVIDKTSKEFAMSVNIYNDNKKGDILPGFDCPDPDSGLDMVGDELIGKQRVESDEYAPFKLLFPGGYFDGESGNTIVCVIYLCYDDPDEPGDLPSTCGVGDAIDQKQITIRAG